MHTWPAIFHGYLYIYIYINRKFSVYFVRGIKNKLFLELVPTINVYYEYREQHLPRHLSPLSLPSLILKVKNRPWLMPLKAPLYMQSSDLVETNAVEI